jgi:hypothetical protein
MTLVEIQARIDALAVAMSDKALKTPYAEFTLKSQASSSVGLHWATTPKSAYNDGYKYFYGTAAETLDMADAYVAALPTPEEARMKAFLGALGDAIELGKKADIEVEAVNPLIALMKRLSKNALTHEAA